MSRHIAESLCLLLLGGMMAGTGCSAPAYSAAEREALIHRNISYDLKQTVDDWDSFWMLRPPSRLTVWNLR